MQLTWQISNANDISIDNGIGNNLPGNGLRQVSPTQDTTYTLTAKGDGGTVVKQVMITVAPMPIANLTVTPQTIQAGQSATLNWDSKNATQVKIDGIATTLSGSMPVTPDKDAQYQMLATGPGGMRSAVASVHVTPKSTTPPSLKTADAEAINDTLHRLSDAYGTESIDEMLKVWPHMNKKAQNELKSLFNSVHAMRVQFEPCGAPTISADAASASISCTQKMSYTVGGKFQPAQPHQITITLKKVGGVWQIENLQG